MEASDLSLLVVQDLPGERMGILIADIIEDRRKSVLVPIMPSAAKAPGQADKGAAGEGDKCAGAARSLSRQTPQALDRVRTWPPLRALR